MENFSNTYVSNCHRKYYLKVHLVFVCKYRKNLLNGAIDLEVKRKIIEISKRSDFTIDIMETDKDHIHLLVNYKSFACWNDIKAEWCIYLFLKW